MRGSKLDEWMTLIFMITAIAAIVCYFAAPSRTPFLVCAGVAIVLRIAQYLLRHFRQ